jgi:hypothetical protein
MGSRGGASWSVGIKGGDAGGDAGSEVSGELRTQDIVECVHKQTGRELRVYLNKQVFVGQLKEFVNVCMHNCTEDGRIHRIDGLDGVEAAKSYGRVPRSGEMPRSDWLT